MKKLLVGFTLAEVLITLGVVGVIARLTIPALVNNVQKHQAEAAFTKAVNTLVSGNAQILAASNTKSLSGAADFTIATYLSKLESQLNGAYVPSQTVKSNAFGSSASKALPAFISKDGIMFTSAAAIGGLIGFRIPRRSSSKYHGSYIPILVDINGAANPNKLAIDQFVFIVDNYGAAIPYGGYEFEQYFPTSQLPIAVLEGEPSRFREVASDGVAQWVANCGEGMTPASGYKAATCTGSIVDNGYKIVYDY